MAAVWGSWSMAAVWGSWPMAAVFGVQGTAKARLGAPWQGWDAPNQTRVLGSRAAAAPLPNGVGTFCAGTSECT